MCTVKKDISISESPILTDSCSSASDYDLLNRKQSQLLLDMIYKTGNCNKVTCTTNPGGEDGAIMEELHRIRRLITDMQTSIAKLPRQIVAALLEADNCLGIRAQIDEIDEDDGFDHLTETTTTSGKRTLSTSSSDIEVLNYYYRKPEPFTLPPIDINKEIQQMAKKFSHFNIQKPCPQFSASEASAKRFASDIFSHWEARYQASKDQVDRCEAPVGNIRVKSPDSLPIPDFVPASTSCTEEVPKILPYNSTIDLNVWLK